MRKREKEAAPLRAALREKIRMILRVRVCGGEKKRTRADKIRRMLAGQKVRPGPAAVSQSGGGVYGVVKPYSIWLH